MIPVHLQQFVDNPSSVVGMTNQGANLKSLEGIMYFLLRLFSGRKNWFAYLGFLVFAGNLSFNFPGRHQDFRPGSNGWLLVTWSRREQSSSLVSVLAHKPFHQRAFPFTFQLLCSWPQVLPGPDGRGRGLYFIPSSFCVFAAS